MSSKQSWVYNSNMFWNRRALSILENARSIRKNLKLFHENSKKRIKYRILSRYCMSGRITAERSLYGWDDSEIETETEILSGEIERVKHYGYTKRLQRL